MKVPFRHLLGLSLVVFALEAFSAALPAPPRTFDTAYSAPTGNIIQVNSGGNLQSAINSAQLGDTIVLQAGATFTGPISLPNKSGSGWIYIRSSAYSSLPAPGRRVSPSDAQNMPKIVGTASGGTALRTAPGAHHYRFVGVEFSPAPGQFLYALVTIGNGESSASSLPNNIVFDRCYIHADPSVGGRRGVAMDGSYIAVIDSHISDFKEQGADSQGLWAYNTNGPLKIVNNHIEAAGENVMFGGADARIANAVPSDIEIRRNHFFKPLSWMGSSWTIKNLLEFKNARRVIVEGNRFENNWAAAQNGFSLLITPRNQDGSAPWSATQDIAITRNTFVNLGQGINISGTDDNYSSQRTARILIQGNVIRVTNLNNSGGRLFQIIHGPTDVTIDHNTGFSTSSYMFAENNPKASQLIFTNNIFTQGSYGFLGTGTGDGVVTLNGFFSNWTFSRNAIIGGSSSAFPSAQMGASLASYFPASVSAVRFVNHDGGDYRLASDSPYKNAGTDGKDIGADLDAIAAASAGTATPALRPAIPGGFQVN